MPSLVQSLTERGLIKPPNFVPTNMHYEAWIGSISYGTSTDTSDCDVLGFVIPTKEIVFPHLTGAIHNFSTNIPTFNQYQQHHIDDKEHAKQYDITVYSIVRYFYLLMQCNPNIVDSIWVPQNCIIHITKIGQMVREHRKMFLHKGVFHKMKSYSYSQLHKMTTKNPEEGSKRKELRDKYGFDVKFAMHVVRLLDECQQILETGELDLQRNREHLKAIRRGEVSEEEIRRWAAEKETYLEKLYETSTLPYGPDEPKIRDLLISCLEEHYGNLDKCVVNVDAAVTALRQINEIIQRNQALLG